MKKSELVVAVVAAFENAAAGGFAAPYLAGWLKSASKDDSDPDIKKMIAAIDRAEEVERKRRAAACGVL